MKKFSHTTIFETALDELAEIQEAITLLISKSENNPDYFEIRAEQKQSIGIKQTRDMINWLQLKPYQSENKLAIIKEAEKLTIEAQNSLLKTLEEPPANSYIFLITKNHRSLLQTIISRARLIRLGSQATEADGVEAEIEILQAPIHEQIKWIEEKTKIKNPIERKNALHVFLSEVHGQVLEQEDRSKKLANLKLIETTLEGLKRNINQKLLLENLLFNFQK